jgi:hypothetical protein
LGTRRRPDRRNRKKASPLTPDEKELWLADGGAERKTTGN